MTTPTLTQNSGLYLAQHTVASKRRALFRRFRLAAKNQSAEVRQLRFDHGYIEHRLHQDNGR
jgi:hypothetical protein